MSVQPGILRRLGNHAQKSRQVACISPPRFQRFVCIVNRPHNVAACDVCEFQEKLCLAFQFRACRLKPGVYLADCRRHVSQLCRNFGSHVFIAADQTVEGVAACAGGAHNRVRAIVHGAKCSHRSRSHRHDGGGYVLCHAVADFCYIFPGSFDFFAKILHFLPGFLQNLLCHIAELLLLFFQLFQVGAGGFKFKLKLGVCSLVDFARCILLFYLFLYRFKVFHPVTGSRNSGLQRGLLFRQQLGAAGVELQRFVHVAQGGLCFLGVCVYRLQRFVKPLGFAVKFDSNALDAL